jgi:chromosome segregation ATPase
MHQLDVQNIQDDLNKQIQSIREQWLQEQRLASQAQAEKSSLQSRISNLEADRNQDRKSLVEALAALETKRSECNDLHRDNNQLHARVESLSLNNTQQTNQLDILNTRVQSLNKQLMASTDETKSWKQDAEAHHREKLDLANENGQLRDVGRQLRDDLKQAQASLYQTQSAREQAILQLEQTEGDKRRAESQLQRTQGELSAANQQVYETQSALSESHAALRVARDTEDELHGQMRSLKDRHEAEVRSLQEARESEVDALRERLRNSEAALYELRHKLKHAQAELNVAIDHNEVDAIQTRHALNSASYRSPTPHRSGPSASTSYTPRPAPQTPSRYSRVLASPTNNYSYQAPRTPLPRPTVGGSVGKTPTQITATVGADAQPVRIAITPMKHRYDE